MRQLHVHTGQGRPECSVSSLAQSTFFEFASFLSSLAQSTPTTAVTKCTAAEKERLKLMVARHVRIEEGAARKKAWLDRGHSMSHQPNSKRQQQLRTAAC
eukprot:scaffold91667_cov15-Tisochrysis_lutea.AAC.1